MAPPKTEYSSSRDGERLSSSDQHIKKSLSNRRTATSPHVEYIPHGPYFYKNHTTDNRHDFSTAASVTHANKEKECGLLYQTQVQQAREPVDGGYNDSDLYQHPSEGRPRSPNCERFNSHSLTEDSQQEEALTADSKDGINRSFEKQQSTSPSRMIEVTPGVRMRLRGAQETWQAVQDDFYMPCSCLFGCSEIMFCIQDAGFVICPDCKTISPLECGSTEGGVGLGFLMNDLAEMQQELIKKNKAVA